MRNLLIILLTVCAMNIGCKKENDRISQEQLVTYPSITFTGNKYVSIRVGDPIPSISATAYDSTLMEVDTVAYDASVVDNTTPGLYIIPFKSKNRYGFVSQKVAYIAVTNVSPAVNLSGKYKRVGTSAIATVTKLATGLYSSDNLFGSTSLYLTFYFAQTGDSTIDIPDQLTSQGLLQATKTSLQLSPGDTAYSYSIGKSLTQNDALRTFIKQ